MTEESVTISSSQSLENVIHELENALTQVGQTAITKKGIITVNPRSKYSGFLSNVDAMEGTVRQRRENVYEVAISYKVEATTACWVVGILGGISLVLPALVFFVPFLTAKNALKNDLKRALQVAVQELE
jgi:hypothetical protein